MRKLSGDVETDALLSCFLYKSLPGKSIRNLKVSQQLQIESPKAILEELQAHRKDDKFQKSKHFLKCVFLFSSTPLLFNGEKNSETPAIALCRPFASSSRKAIICAAHTHTHTHSLSLFYLLGFPPLCSAPADLIVQHCPSVHVMKCKSG